MALVVADRVQETTNTTGVGTLTLAGAVAGFQSFSVIGNANTTFYTIISGNAFEIGIGTYTLSGTTLSRDTVLTSSLGGTTKISVTAGSFVFCTYPATKSINADGATFLGQIVLRAGTATAGTAPLRFLAGTLNTTAEAGAFEYDGDTFYSSVAASTRGVVPSEQRVVLTANNTLTSQTAAQAIFDGGGGPTNGAVTLPIGTYQFECVFALTNMSTTSGSFGFTFGGTSTKTFAAMAIASKATSLTAPASNAASASYTTFNTAANTALVANTTATNGTAFIKGTIRVTVAGTLIPQISLTQAAAAVIQANSYFKLSRIGNATVTTVGNWS